MSTTIDLSVIKSALAIESSPNQNLSGQASYEMLPSDGRRFLYLGFDAFPNSLKNYNIESVQVVVRCPYLTRAKSFYLYDALSDFNAQTLTWNNKPQIRSEGLSSSSTVSYSYIDFYIPKDHIGNQDGVQRLHYPALAIELYRYNSTSSVEISISDIKLRVTYNSSQTVTSRVHWNSSQPQYINPHIANAFSWNLQAEGGNSYNSIDGFSQTSAVFYWRMGDSGSFTSISISGNNTNLSVPANTFSVGTLQYYVSATGSDGTTTQTPIYNVSTSDTLPVSTPLFPKNTVENGNEEIILKWNVENASGTAPTKIELAYKIHGSSAWVYINNLSGSLREYAIPANTFTAGESSWSVRAYNIDGNAGSWSAVNFVVVAAPPTPGIACNNAPFTTFNWQGSGQQAWRLTVDGKVYGPYFGTEQSFTLPDYLEDGAHSASLEIQGQYGLWSQPGTISFSVINSPGLSITLSGSFGRDCALSWSTAAVVSNFYIYRDGVRIGHTAENEFTDRFVLGEHIWQIINRLPSGMYTASNAISGMLRSCTTAVALFSGGDWIELALSENSDSEQRFSYARTHSLRHMRGAVYPVLELSPYEDGSGSYNTAFPDAPSAAAFEALRGKLVILKSRGGNVLIGAMTSMEKRNKDFYISYTFTVQRCHWEDYVDA